MARKLLGPDDETDQSATERTDRPAQRPRRRSSLVTGGAAAPKYIESSARSKSDRTHQDIALDQIQDSLIEDRIDVTEGLEELMESIEKNGQQIPIIVRIVNDERPYEIVAGRRRMAALRRLGKSTVRGYITRMSDKEAFVAQGIENSARLETSFIERARTAVKAADASFTQRDVAEFLGISQTLINFMARIYEALGEDLVCAIGPARGVGRRKWEKLVSQSREKKLGPTDMMALVDSSIEDSAERFEALLAAVEAGQTPRKKAATPPSPARKTDLMGGRYAMTRKPKQLLIKGDRTASDDLLDYISERVPELIQEFEARQEEESKG